MKPEECKDCPLFVEGKEPKPIEIDYEKWSKDDDGNIDVLFVGEAFNGRAKEPFEGTAGKLLYEYIDHPYKISHYGVTNMYKCRYSNWSMFNAKSRPGPHCRDAFIDELKYNPKLIVFLGTFASKAVTKKSVGEMPDAVTTINLRGQECHIITTSHPTSIDHCDDRDENWKVWNRRWLKIAEYLKGEVLNVIPI